LYCIQKRAFITNFWVESENVIHIELLFQTRLSISLDVDQGCGYPGYNFFLYLSYQFLRHFFTFMIAVLLRYLTLLCINHFALQGQIIEEGAHVQKNYKYFIFLTASRYNMSRFSYLINHQSIILGNS